MDLLSSIAIAKRKMTNANTRDLIYESCLCASDEDEKNARVLSTSATMRVKAALIGSTKADGLRNLT